MRRTSILFRHVNALYKFIHNFFGHKTRGIYAKAFAICASTFAAGLFASISVTLSFLV